MTTFHMWDNVPGLCEEEPVLEWYEPQEKKSNAAIVIFPGGAYQRRAPHEGKGVAERMNELGYNAFVCEYRVFPHTYPLPLLDARRAIRFVRKNADLFGIDVNKVIMMGFSAGANLTALTSTFFEKLDFEGTDDTDNESFIPNGAAVCYPVISLIDEKLIDKGCNRSLVRDEAELARKITPELNVNGQTPPTFIWQVSDDDVTVLNSYLYAKTLRQHNIPCEMHIFPQGGHGLGAAPNNPHVAQWTELFDNWVKLLF